MYLQKYKVDVLNPMTILPISLLLIDDYVLPNKVKGIKCCLSVIHCLVSTTQFIIVKFIKACASCLFITKTLSIILFLSTSAYFFYIPHISPTAGHEYPCKTSCFSHFFFICSNFIAFSIIFSIGPSCVCIV